MNQLFTCAKIKFENVEIHMETKAQIVSTECVPEVVSNWFGLQWHVSHLPLDTDAFVWKMQKKNKWRKLKRNYYCRHHRIMALPVYIHLRLNVGKAMLSLRSLLVLAKFHVSVALNPNYWKSLNSNRRYSNRLRTQLRQSYCKVTIGLLQNVEKPHKLHISSLFHLKEIRRQ